MKSEWEDSQAIIIKKSKVCPSCGREDYTIGDWFNSIMYKLEQTSVVVVKANQRNLATAERLKRMLHVVGVNETERKVEEKEMTYHGKKNKNTFICKITAIRFEKIPALKGLERE